MAEGVLGDVIAVFKYIPKGTSKCNIVKLKKRVLISDMFVRNMELLKYTRNQTLPGRV